MRKDIEINAEGTILRGWFYTPDRPSGKASGIVMAHGFSAVKEMYLDRFAEHSARPGLAAVVFDNRNFGASDGHPRQESIRGRRYATTAMRSRGLGCSAKSIPSGLAYGVRATLAATRWSSARSTGA